jgi:serine/threonine-protein kinase
MIDDLSTALEVEAARAGSTTGEATSVLDAVPPAKRKLSSRARWSWAAIALLVLVAAGALAAVQLISSGSTPGGGGALKDKGSTVALSSATDYDPQGDGVEDSATVELAVDGNLSTAWSSEHYDSQTFAGTKTGPDPGVGLYVTAKSPATPTEMVIRTPSPGWDGQIYAAASGPPEDLSGWGEPVGAVTEAAENEEVELNLSEPAKYFLIWFNKASPARDQEGRYQVEISDVKLIE